MRRFLKLLLNIIRLPELILGIILGIYCLCKFGLQEAQNMSTNPNYLQDKNFYPPKWAVILFYIFYYSIMFKLIFL